ncbi:MAG: hypothetical protein K2K76_04665 [Muribaculaceae bacterium]|nr:hypothetical protein [Muribaculaceae bacterium]
MTPDPQFLTYLSDAIGAEEARRLIDEISQGIPATSVRANPAKPAHLDILTGESSPVPWNPLGHYLNERPKFTFDPALHQGLYYVQEASSMFAGFAAKSVIGIIGDTPVNVLDACAAPGGKATALADVLPPGSTVVANEFDRTRSAVLAENIAKWGNPAVIVTQGDTARFRKMRGAFDIVLVDAPCSGEGMMRKDAKAIEQWTPALVSQCVARQKEILDNLAPTITPGGFLIYSTCTFNRHENEDMVGWLVENYSFEPVSLTVDPAWGIVTTSASGITCYRFMPSHLRGEGLFMAVMRRPGSHTSSATKLLSSRRNDKSIAQVESWAPSLVMHRDADCIFGLPPASVSMLKELVKNGINIISQGVTVANVKGRDFIPDTALALSTSLNPEAFPAVPVSRDEAIAYLRRETVTLPSSTPRGHVLLTHSGYPLGFVKNLGNRANNLYPTHWRIRSNAHD